MRLSFLVGCLLVLVAGQLPAEPGKEGKPIKARLTLKDSNPDTLLDYLIEATKPVREVEPLGNEVAYEDALGKARKAFAEVYGNTLSWESRVHSIPREGVDLVRELPARVEGGPPSYALSIGREYVVEADRSPDEFLRHVRISADQDREWVVKQRAGNRVRMTGTVFEILYMPSPTARSKDRGGKGWWYSYHVIVKDAKRSP